MPAYLYLQNLCTLSKENIMQNKYELQRVLAKITLCADRRTDRQTAQQTRFETPFCKQATNFIWKWCCCCCWSALWRAFIYTDRRALSAHLFGTLVQYEYKWMHIYNINTRPDKAQTHTHTVLRHTHTVETGNRAIITVLCVESKQKQQTKWTANHIEKFNENKRTNGRSCRCQQPTTIQHQRENERVSERKRSRARESAGQIAAAAGL